MAGPRRWSRRCAQHATDPTNGRLARTALSTQITNPRLQSLLWTSIVDLVSARSRAPLVLGICGAQGSGKSTLASELIGKLRREGLAVATLSLDDIYLTRAEREALARDVHPLLGTRGVPGTHDVALGLSLLRDIDAGKPVLLPRFDKLADDRLPREGWEQVDQPLDVLIFEGWCVGARPQPAALLGKPVNGLERDSDPDGIWRAYVNAALAGDYQTLFARIDFLTLLAAPAWDVVLNWRMEQERGLQKQGGAEFGSAMDVDEVARFIQHYERLTRYILEEMPGRADLTIPLGIDRSWRTSPRDAG